MASNDLEWQRKKRRENNNLWTKRYEKTKKGFLMRLYRNMKSRVFGVQKIKYHLYKDKPLVDKVVFYDWALKNPDFERLFDEWEKSGYMRRLSPSVDRIDPEKGYEIENMRWITFSDNSRYGGIRTQKIHKNYKKNLVYHHGTWHKMR